MTCAAKASLNSTRSIWSAVMTGVAQGLAGRRDRAEAHHLRLHAGDAETDDAGDRVEPEFARLRFAHDQRRADAVVGGAAVAGRDQDLLAGRAHRALDARQLAESLDVRARPDAFIAVEDDHRAVLALNPVAFVVEDRLFDLEWDDLVLVDALLVGLDGLAVAVDGELIELFAGQAIDLGRILCGLDHREDRRIVEDFVLERHAEDGLMVGRHVALLGGHLEATLVEFGDAGGLAARSAAERAAHALDAEGDAAIGGADHDRLSDAVERLHARSALAVGVDCRDFGGQAGQVGDRIGADAGKFAGAADVAHGDILDHARRYLRDCAQEGRGRPARPLHQGGLLRGYRGRHGQMPSGRHQR